jgi:purine-nucleoside/S-methyl-5'-thioadenosine phosphorylase / adenosine deaminase
VIRWDAPPGYVVAFTTRDGGVSEGPYASLNLGLRTGDEVARVAENRRRACSELELDATRLAFNRQRHSPSILRADSHATGRDGDGLWTDERELPLLALTADCLPIAIAAANGRPALAVVHAGWRGLADGVVENAVEALGGGPALAVIGPAIGPCCYEVGPEVAARFDPDLTRDGNLDLWSAGERALRRAGVDRVDRVDLCTRCRDDLFFSHRRQGRVRGVQGVIGALAG